MDEQEIIRREKRVWCPSALCGTPLLRRPHARKDMFGGLQSVGRCASNSPLGALQSLTNGARGSTSDHPAAPRTPPRRPARGRRYHPLISFVRGVDHERLCADRGRREPDPSDAAPSPTNPRPSRARPNLGPRLLIHLRSHRDKKQGGSSNNGRDSNPKFLGIKAFGGEHVIPGNIIARQRGTKGTAA